MGSSRPALYLRGQSLIAIRRQFLGATPIASAKSYHPRGLVRGVAFNYPGVTYS